MQEPERPVQGKGRADPAPDPDTPHSEIIRRFQQLTPPLAAKSLEDTVFYRYGSLLSRNEVGSDPDVIAASVDEFHRRNVLRAARFPAALLATATHDHKRGEDARARLAVLSQVPERWQQACQRWAEWSSSLPDSRTASGRAERYLLWQTLVAAWPLDLNIADARAVARFALRIADWQRKALREAKLNSSWFEPDTAYETASAQYMYELLGWPPVAARTLALGADVERSAAGHNPQAGLLRSFHEFVQGIAAAGALNGLVQTVLRLTVPGVPDQYQGTEWWDHSLVDPDNRRPVDYEQREQALASTGPGADMTELLKNWQDGRIKQAVIRRVLGLRSTHSEVFSQGDYVPLKVAGPRKDHLIAFMRCRARTAVVVVVPRLTLPAHLSAGQAGLKMDMTYWDDTGIMVPKLPGTGLQDVFTGSALHPVADHGVQARTLFTHFPFAVLATH